MMYDSNFNSIDEKCVLMSGSDFLEAATDASTGGVVVASSLSNLLVVKCIKHNVRVIITRESNIASHAANILRAVNAKKKCVEWVHGVEIDRLYAYVGRNVLYRNGYLWINGETSPVMIRGKQHEKNDFVVKAIAKLNLINKNVSHIYYPETHFSLFAFSLMKKSLENELNTYFFVDAEVNLVDELLEFKNAPSLSIINQFACDFQQSEKYYFEMMKNYISIVESLRSNPWDFLCLCENAEKYYSSFLVLHRSYNLIFSNMSNKLRNDIGPISEYVCSEIMHSKIDYWLSFEHNTLLNKKVFLQDEPIAKIPEFSVEDDIEDSIARVKKVFLELKKEKYYRENEDWIKLHSIIFVLKEWKFVIYKIIFTHFKCLIENNEMLMRLPKDKVASMTKDEVLKYYE